MMDLITGHQGFAHITAEQVAEVNRAMTYGAGDGVVIRLVDGLITSSDFSIEFEAGYWRANGYDIQITENEVIYFDPASAGTSRIDNYYVEILQDIASGNQRAEIVRVEGIEDATPVAPSDPTGPELTSDILLECVKIAYIQVGASGSIFTDLTTDLGISNPEIAEQLDAINNYYGSKNLCKTTVDSFVDSGLTVTVNDDGTILITGISTDTVTIVIHDYATSPISIEEGTKLFCKLTDDPRVDYYDGITFRHTDLSVESYGISPSGLQFTAQKDITDFYLYVSFQSGVYMGANGFLLEPMLCLACMNDGKFTPYTKPTSELSVETDNLRADLGYKSDAASVAGSAFQRIAYNDNRIGTLNGSVGGLRNDLGYSGDTASSTGSAFARIAALNSALTSQIKAQIVAIGAVTFNAGTGTWTFSSLPSDMRSGYHGGVMSITALYAYIIKIQSVDRSTKTITLQGIYANTETGVVTKLNGTTGNLGTAILFYE